MNNGALRNELRAALRAIFPENHEQSEITPIAGDASARRYFRAMTGGATVVLMWAPEDEAVAQFAAMTSLMGGLGADTPRIHGFRGRVMALEDLGGVLLQDHIKTMTREAALNEYEAIIESLAMFQERSIRRAGGNEPCFTLRFDIEKLNYEIEFANEHFLNGHLNAGADEDALAPARAEWARVTEKLAEKTPVLAHRDFHSRNIMVKGERRVWIDYQDARMGRPQYDLASLLEDPYADLPDGAVESLVKRYFDIAPAAVKGDDGFDAFMELYRLSAAQRLYKALGTYGYQSSVKKTDIYLPYISPAAAALARTLKSGKNTTALYGAMARLFEKAGMEF